MGETSLDIVVWLVVAIGGLVLAFAAAEIALRLTSSKLRPLTEWRSWEMQHKVAAMDEVAREGGASVVAIGSSMINAAVDPDRLSLQLRRSRPAFNAGLNGAGIRLLELWTLKVVVPTLRPDV